MLLCVRERVHTAAGGWWCLLIFLRQGPSLYLELLSQPLGSSSLRFHRARSVRAHCMPSFLHEPCRSELTSSSLLGKHFPTVFSFHRPSLMTCFVSPLVTHPGVTSQTHYPIHHLRATKRACGRDPGRLKHQALRLQSGVLSCTPGVLSLAADNILDWLIHCCGDDPWHVGMFQGPRNTAAFRASSSTPSRTAGYSLGALWPPLFSLALPCRIHHQACKAELSVAANGLAL